MATGNASLRLDCLSPQLVDPFWWLIEGLVDRLVARAHGEFTAAGLKSRAVSGDLLLWVVTSPSHSRAPLAILVIRLEDWSGDIVARVYGAAGDLHAIRAVKDEGERRMRQMGATRMIFEGRFGWAKALKDYRPMKIVMEKAL